MEGMVLLTRGQRAPGHWPACAAARRLRRSVNGIPLGGNGRLLHFAQVTVLPAARRCFDVIVGSFSPQQSMRLTARGKDYDDPGGTATTSSARPTRATAVACWAVLGVRRQGIRLCDGARGVLRFGGPRGGSRSDLTGYTVPRLQARQHCGPLGVTDMSYLFYVNEELCSGADSTTPRKKRDMGTMSRLGPGHW